MLPGRTSGAAALKREHFAAAMVELQWLLAQCGFKDLSSLISRSMAYFTLYRFEMSVQEALTSIKADDDVGKAYRLLGCALDGLGHYPEAWVSINRSLANAPTSGLLVGASLMKIVEKHLLRSQEEEHKRFHAAIEEFKLAAHEDRSMEQEMRQVMDRYEQAVDKLITMHTPTPHLNVMPSASPQCDSYEESKILFDDVASKIPVTVIFGYKGAGKTTTANHIVRNMLKEQPQQRIGWIRNVCHAEQEGSAEGTAQAQPDMLTHQNVVSTTIAEGCICCTARMQFVEHIKHLITNEQVNYLIVEANPVAQVLALAHVLKCQAAAEVCRLDTLVTVIDSSRFFDLYCEGSFLKDKQLAVSPRDYRSVVDVIVDHIEYGGVLVCNKVDLVTNVEQELDTLEAVLRALNCKAAIVQVRHGQVPLDYAVNTTTYDEQAITTYPGWVQELTGHQLTSSPQHRIETRVYRRQRPFHPKRLWDAITGGRIANVLRLKGHFWIATNPDLVLMWTIAGPKTDVWVAGEWLAAKGAAKRGTVVSPMHRQKLRSLLSSGSGSPLPSPVARSCATQPSLSRDSSATFEFDDAPTADSPMRVSLCSRLSTLGLNDVPQPRMSQIMDAFAFDSSACNTPVSTTAGKRGFEDSDFPTMEAFATHDENAEHDQAGLELPLPPPKLLSRPTAFSKLTVSTNTPSAHYITRTPSGRHAMQGSLLPWHRLYGDRRIELVITGIDADLDAIEEILDRALLTEFEENQGVKEWKSYPNPFHHEVGLAQDLLNLGKVFHKYHSSMPGASSTAKRARGAPAGPAATAPLPASTSPMP